MSKKITSITINNFKAYYDSYVIEIPEGQNLLIYGENGSGKSSLYKAINNYLLSSRNTAIPFVKNRHLVNEDGEIDICFSDFDDSISKIIPHTAQHFSFGSISSTNRINFIQDSALVKGFLDYTDLLKVYFHEAPQPNLFSLIVLNLLGEHIPIQSGGNFKFRDKWNQLQEDLTRNAYTRMDVCHKRAKRELPTFQTHLISTLNEVFGKLNSFLETYFPEIGITVGYVLKDIVFNYVDYKPDWWTTTDLRLTIVKENVPIAGGYTDVLNEARMSAFAICLYLASLKCNPSSVSFKVLYLDDIFIGLDSGNRLPILNIILNEFSDYQVFISTYDRYTYEVAKRHFESIATDRWLHLELYVTKQTTGTLTFDKPLMVSNVDEFTNAVYYLHHTIKPDYPAAANYFRKHAENILLDFLPPHEAKNQDYQSIESYKLNELLNATIRFFKKINTPDVLLVRLKNSLPTILHPLSHFNLASPIYKVELIEIQQCLFELKAFLQQTKNRFRQFLPQSKILQLKFTINPNDIGYFDISVNEMIYLVNNVDGSLTLSSGKCSSKSTYTIINNVTSIVTSFPKNDPKFQYSSLEEAYDKILLHLQATPRYNALVKAVDYATEFQIFQDGNVNELNNLMVW